MNNPILTIFRSQKKVLIGLFGLAAVLLFHESWLQFIGDALVVADVLQPVDVIHVIAGDDYRTDYAIQLFQKGYGKTLFYTGGWCQIHLYRHGEHARERSLARGVPPSAIAFDDTTVISTYMEAERLKEWITHSSTPVRSIIVVSDPFHMRRSRWIYERIFGDQVRVIMAPVPFALTPFQRTWWKDPESRENVKDEYSKFIYYLFRYQYSSGKFRDWLASLDTE